MPSVKMSKKRAARSKKSEPEKPVLWIVAGPNGSGKSTLHERTNIQDFGRSVWIINPDLLTARLISQEKISAANAEALNRIKRWLYASLRAHQTVGVETVLSTPKYRALVKFAKSLGFEIRLLYVTLDTVERNIARVKARVAEGGHSVPVDKIRARRERSFRQLPWFLDQADIALIYDNSTATPKLMARKEGETLVIDRSASEPIRKAAASLKAKWDKAKWDQSRWA